MKLFSKYMAPAVAAAGVMLGASASFAVTACTDATAADFGSVADYNSWISGTDGGADDFVTTSNGTTMCQFSSLGGAPNDNGNNVDAFFSGSVDGDDWIYNDKDEDDYDSTGNLQTVANGTDSSFAGGGDFTILDAFFDLYDFALLVFKDGQQSPDRFIAYKVEQTVDGTDVTGTWRSMWFNKNGNGLTDATSHITLYGGQCPTTDPNCGGGGGTGVVPLPAGLPLLLTALGVVGLIGRRARKTA